MKIQFKSGALTINRGKQEQLEGDRKL